MYFRAASVLIAQRKEKHKRTAWPRNVKIRSLSPLEQGVGPDGSRGPINPNPNHSVSL